MAGNWHRIGDIKGRDGVGVPTGGARGDVLKKEGGTDYATSWGAVEYADIQGKVPASALPEIGTAPYVVDSQAAMLNLPAVPGRQAIRTDIGATFVLAQEPASTLENWVEMVSRSDVTSVNDKTGSVVLTKADVGLAEVNNTADSDKPVATQSVRGLMSSADKTKLDGATHSSTSNSVARRDSGGRIAFTSVALSDQPSQSGHAVPLGFLQTALEGKFNGTVILDQEDLDTVTEDGVYGKVGTADIGNPDLHYPPGSTGAGVLLVTSYSTTGIIHEWTTWGTGNASRVRKWIRNSNDTGETWTDWREMAGKELATSSRDGLMARADKAKLDDATRSNRDGSIMVRGTGYNPAHIGRAETDNITYIGQNASGPQAVANKKYVDDTVNRLVAGGTIGFDQSWNTMGSLSRAGIVEGWPDGAPAGQSSGLADFQAGYGFVKDPVWRFHHEVMGLGYHRQTAELLSCDPTYMIGFTWERTYHPGNATWTRWNCIAGDTGPIESSPSTGGGSRTREWVAAHHVGRIYKDIAPFRIRRVVNTIHFHGAAQPGSNPEALATNDGVGIAYIRYDNAWPIRRIWLPEGVAVNGTSYEGVGVQQGSTANRWYLNLSDDPSEERLDFYAARYGPTEPSSSSTWLPFHTSWTAPQLATWELQTFAKG